jgi:predicted house-cleaning noncanonical NTP pyrophosphatase (MazG superfamily)
MNPLKKVKLIRDFLKPSGTKLRKVEAPLRAALLIGKLHEEVQEIADDLGDAREYADVYQALMDLAELSGVAWKDVEYHLVQKREQKGGFSHGNVMVVEVGAKPRGRPPATNGELSPNEAAMLEAIQALHKNGVDDMLWGRLAEESEIPRGSVAAALQGLIDKRCIRREATLTGVVFVPMERAV